MESSSLEKLDDIDLRIVNLLQDDSRLSFNKIASKLGISVGTAYNRIKSLEQKGVLKGYTVLVDPFKLGFAMTAIVLIQAEGAHLVEVEKEIAKRNSVVSVYDITGDFDIAVVVRFKDRTGLNAFVKSLLSIPYVKRTVTNVVLNVVKEDFRARLP
ncbi:MAG: Lrp/AsnC family transcriptional regulator [Candidatus Bathyarchaeota archaeon]|nr:Lrp/AsnC family transcriptional regulator [Candidatus Bathyarchaeota archaeon]